MQVMVERCSQNNNSSLNNFIICQYLYCALFILHTKPAHNESFIQLFCYIEGRDSHTWNIVWFSITQYLHCLLPMWVFCHGWQLCIIFFNILLICLRWLQIKHIGQLGFQSTLVSHRAFFISSIVLLSYIICNKNEVKMKVRCCYLNTYIS